MKTNNSAILFEGNSEFDDNPIVAIATGFNGGSNEKLGANIVQVWILRSDIDPGTAVKTKEDSSTCGTCPLRRKVCYVNYAFAPSSIYKAYKEGSYEPLSQAQKNKMSKYQKVLRLTAYGDLGALGFVPMEPLIEVASKVLGYTHAWSLRPNFKGRLMASVNSVKTALIAQKKGWKTFRTKLSTEPLLPGEVLCPNEVNPAIQCEDCLLCTGNTTNVAITVHGLDWKVNNYQKLPR